MTTIVTGDQEKAKKLSEKFCIEHFCGYDGYDALPRSGKIDTIYLALPNSQHRDCVGRASDAVRQIFEAEPAEKNPSEPGNRRGLFLLSANSVRTGTRS